jgi:hypothetical protein
LIAKEELERRIIEEGRTHFEKHRTQELQRQRQQGLGRPIISTKFKDYQFVAVANKMYYGKWRTFADFLGDYVKNVMGPAWGNAELTKPLGERHPVLQWYDKVCHLQAAAHAKAKGELFATPLTGAASAYTRLAYNLYLIAHNGKDIQTRLIERLRDKSGFQGAFFETQVAAWLTRAGFELEFEDESDRSSTHCEFTATHIATGEMFSVEAKYREIQSTNSSREKLVRKLHQALDKKASHKRLIFLNLNKPLLSPEAAELAMNRAERLIAKAEADPIKSAAYEPAYVCITNMNDQFVLDTPSVTMMILFCGYKIPDFMGKEYSSLREAARARERHAPMFQLFKSMEEHQEIPQTFGGELPSEEFTTSPEPRLQVGQTYNVPRPDGVEVAALLTHVLVHDDKAICAFHDPKADVAWMGSFPMSADEIADYERHPDTYFGLKNQRANREAESPMDLFDFFVDGHRNTPKERLVELLRNSGTNEDVSKMTQMEMVELYAEGCVWGVINSAGAPIPKRMRTVGTF